jgi:hypothetical protein
VWIWRRLWKAPDPGWGGSQRWEGQNQSGDSIVVSNVAASNAAITGLVSRFCTRGVLARRARRGHLVMARDVPLPDVSAAVAHSSRPGMMTDGDCLPSHDSVALVELYQQDRLPMEKFVTEKISLDDVGEAFTTIKRDEVLRWV